ncbi:hypothetical protein VaNZ11_013884 [Volvox africanus]|uniref:Uncharacterized protein n=1 Tax=Volvox africanus TaxID=51714 RepID=A0ABQ5SIE7_9CHLO|nr:hypothetical protein VaNZ11_013884 [Volvox africanus]
MSSEAANSLIEELKRDAEKGELLLWASARGLTDDVIELVQTGADPSAKDKRARQAVHYAASNGHLQILEYLFTKGVLLDAEDDIGRGALHYAAAGGHAACVLFLLGKECWRDAPDAADDTPLHLAARSGNVATVRALVEAHAKTALPNKRSLTPFAEAVLAGRIGVAEVLGAAMDGGLEGALACTYRDVPLLHLAAGLGQAAVVEWLVRQQRCDISATTGERRYTPLHAAALSADANTVTVLLRLGADPLAQTVDGLLPLELVPRAAPCKAILSPSSSTEPQAAAAGDPDAAAAAAAAEADPLSVRLARRAFRQLARAAAEQVGVEMVASTTAAAAETAKTKARRKVAPMSSRSAAIGEKAGAAAAAAAAAVAAVAAVTTAEGAEESEEFSSPAAICLRQLLSMTSEQQIAKVELYARMIERQVQELSYLDVNAQAAVTVLRQTMGMVESFGAIAALRADEDFQSDIRDPGVRNALAEARRTNDLSRYEDQPAVMSVAAKFKRLHAVTRKAGGLQVVIDDLRAELPGNDPSSTAAKMEEMRGAQREAAEAAVKAILASVSAAVPEHVRDHLVSACSATVAAAAAVVATKAAAVAGVAGDKGNVGKALAAEAASGGGPNGGSSSGGFHGGEDDKTFQARIMAQKERMDKLRAAASSAWSSNAVDATVGYVDRMEKEFEAAAARAEGKHRRRLADYVGEEMAQSLIHTFKALVTTAIAFLVMWLFGLMPHQQTKALLARQEAQLAAVAAREAAARLSQLEGLGESEGGSGGGIADPAVGAQ